MISWPRFTLSLTTSRPTLPVPPSTNHRMSNPDARESFRRRSLIAAVCRGSIKGFGAHGYILALDAAARL